MRSKESGVNPVTRQENSAEELAGTIRKRPYSVLRDNCLTKSVEFARRCAAMGLEARVVSCLALFRLRVPVFGFKVPVLGPHFYTEVLGKQYEVSHESRNDKQSAPRVLVRLRGFQVPCSKSSQGN